MGAGWLTLRSIRRDATELVDGPIHDSLIGACEHLCLRRIPELLVTDQVASPAVTGVFHPAILIPSTIAKELGDDPMRAVLLHETAHVARHDQVIVIAQNVACGLYWFHPLVRMVNRLFSQSREEVCDNFVLRVTTAPSYSRTLLGLAQHITKSPGKLPATVGMLDDWKLESRVAELLRIDRDRKTRLSRRNVGALIATASCLVGIGIASTVSVSANQPAETQNTSDAGESSKAMKDSKSGAPRATPDTRFGLPADTQFEFTGRVLDPNRRPVEGARIYIARRNAKPLAVSDSNGEFSFRSAKRTLPNNCAWGTIKLVAVAEDFGLAISPILRFESTGKGMQDLQAKNPNRKFDFGNRPNVLNLVKDVPLQGQLVDLEGQPIGGITVQARYTNQAYIRFAIPGAVTDDDGRFEIRGIGEGPGGAVWLPRAETPSFSVLYARTKKRADGNKIDGVGRSVFSSFQRYPNTSCDLRGKVHSRCGAIDPACWTSHGL